MKILEQQQNFRICFDLCPDFVFVLDMEGRVITTNPAVRAALGYKELELLGLSVLSLHPPDLREEARQVVKAMIRGETELCWIPLLARDGTKVPVETRVISGWWNNEPCLFGYSRDMTDKKQSERLKPLIGKSKTQSIILHNITNALVPCLTHIEDLEHINNDIIIEQMLKCHGELAQKKEGFPCFSENIDRNSKIISYLGKLIDALSQDQQRSNMDITAIRNSLGYISDILMRPTKDLCETNQNRERVCLADVVEDAIKIQWVSQFGSILLRKQLHHDVTVITHRNSLMQVVMNLFQNACESVMALGDDETLKKEINIRIYHRQEKPCLEIRDSGIGIETDMIDTIFKSGVSGKGSTGFGLYYCKTWLDANGGSISMESDGQNKGSLVRIIFNC